MLKPMLGTADDDAGNTSASTIEILHPQFPVIKSRSLLIISKA
jgi:hypothetical protein